MLVQGLGPKSILPMDGSKKIREKAPVKAAQAVDTVELSGVAQIRLELLEKVRKNIKNGFYNSENVIDDLSQSFAKALDETL